MPGDGSPDIGVIVTALAGEGNEGWVVIAAEQDPVANRPPEMARTGDRELMRVMQAAGYEVTT